MWKLGTDGDFQLESGDPSAWFSHQHDAKVESDGMLTLFDNSNLRRAADGKANSRGQVLELDEVKKTARFRMNAGDFNPKVQLTQPELRDFQIIAVQITQPRISSILDLASGGGDRKYGVYVRFREGGGDRCMTLALEWRSKTEDWSVSHPGTMDSCGPAW